MNIDELRKLAGLSEGEGTSTKVAVGHVDNERDMIMKELYIIGKNAVELHRMLKDLPDADFPHWWQGKVTKSSEYLTSAKDYLDSELNAEEEKQLPAVIPQDEDDIDPSGVS